MTITGLVILSPRVGRVVVATATRTATRTRIPTIISWRYFSLLVVRQPPTTAHSSSDDNMLMGHGCCVGTQTPFPPHHRRWRRRIRLRPFSSTSPSAAAAAAAAADTGDVDIYSRTFVPFDPPPSQQQADKDSPLSSTKETGKIFNDKNNTTTMPLSIPMTVVDMHLRNEQLPFAYFFRGTHLDEQDLEQSLRRVLQHFPVLAGYLGKTRIHVNHNNSSGCGEASGVYLSFARSQLPIEYWTKQIPPTLYSGAGHPTLLPLFRPLFVPGSSSSSWSSQQQQHQPPLTTIQVTYLMGDDETATGTVIGINTNHAVADAASCFRFVSCWGREMRQRTYPTNTNNNRSSATLSGMLTNDIADDITMTSMPPSELTTRIIPTAWLDQIGSIWNNNNMFAFADDENPNSKESAPVSKPSALSIGHEYVHLEFTPDDLVALKSHGMDAVTAIETNLGSDPYYDDDILSFVSTNDVVTAFGFLLCREISGNDDWNLSMVVNLRGQGGVDTFSDLSSAASITQYQTASTSSAEAAGSSSQGLFGNGITNVLASFPSCGDKVISDIDAVSSAACSIRRALQGHSRTVSERISASRIGRCMPQPSVLTAEAPVSGPSFSTTSWGQFDLWDDVGFVRGSRVDNFVGYPLHPLPHGETYNSVLVPRHDGGCTYKLLLPSSKVQQAQLLHQQWLDSFREWYTTIKERNCTLAKR